MRGMIALTAACAAAAAVTAEERWEVLIAGQIAGSQTVQESAAAFCGTGSFTFQGAKVESSYQLAFDASGAPASYARALAVAGAKITVTSSVASGSLTLAASRNGAAAGTGEFPLSPALVILDNNVSGQYRQQARLDRPMLFLRGARDFQAGASDLAAWQRGLAGRANVSFATLADLNHLLVEVPDGPSTGVEYFREGWVSSSAVEAVAAGLAR